MTSCDLRNSDSTRAGILRIGKAPMSVTWRDSSITSLRAVAQQVSTKPAISSSALRALLWCGPCVTSPESFLHLQEPQAPSLQP